MSLSEKTAKARILAVTGATLAILTILASCQVKPLYSDGPATAGKLASISFSEADDRVEQQVRNALIFLTAGGAGEALNPQYHVELNASVKNIGVLLEQESDTPRAGRIVVTADYNLTRIDTGETLKSGKRSSVALVDYSVQEYSKVRAIRDAENRAAKELAEVIRADLAMALGR